MAQIMTTKELSRYLKLHEITISKYASEGKIPAIRIGRICRFDKDVIDHWIATGQTTPETEEKPKKKVIRRKPEKKKSRR